jgi:hypothetical protein
MCSRQTLIDISLIVSSGIVGFAIGRWSKKIPDGDKWFKVVNPLPCN